QAAVARESVAMLVMLLEQRASAALVGAGRWVLHPQLAPILARAGASIDRSGSWIGLVCTGNQGRKDDPDFVTALLRHGARGAHKQECGYGPVPEQAAIDDCFLRRIVEEIEHRHLVAHPIAWRIAADAVLEFDQRIGLSPETDDRIVAIAAMVAGLTLEPDHLA